MIWPPERTCFPDNVDFLSFESRVLITFARARSIFASSIRSSAHLIWSTQSCKSCSTLSWEQTWGTKDKTFFDFKTNRITELYKQMQVAGGASTHPPSVLFKLINCFLIPSGTLDQRRSLLCDAHVIWELEEGAFTFHLGKANSLRQQNGAIAIPAKHFMQVQAMKRDRTNNNSSSDSGRGISAIATTASCCCYYYNYFYYYYYYYHHYYYFFYYYYYSYYYSYYHSYSSYSYSYSYSYPYYYYYYCYYYYYYYYDHDHYDYYYYYYYYYYYSYSYSDSHPLPLPLSLPLLLRLPSLFQRNIDPPPFAAKPGEIVVFSHVKWAWPSSWL